MSDTQIRPRFYFRLRTGLGTPRGLWPVLASFQGGIHRWASTYRLGPSVVLVLDRYRFGPFVWGREMPKGVDLNGAWRDAVRGPQAIQQLDTLLGKLSRTLGCAPTCTTVVAAVESLPQPDEAPPESFADVS